MKPEHLKQFWKRLKTLIFAGWKKRLSLLMTIQPMAQEIFIKNCLIRFFTTIIIRARGAALRTGFKNATGDIIVIQDADLEYDPSDYSPLIKLILDGHADVCYGTRLAGGKPSRSFMFTHLLGNKFLSLLTNILYGSTLTDMETCYKAFKADFIKDIEIKSNRFDFEPEITAKVLKRGARLYELPVSYYGREFSEGKKITWKDGFHAIIALIKYRFTD